MNIPICANCKYRPQTIEEVKMGRRPDGNPIRVKSGRVDFCTHSKVQGSCRAARLPGGECGPDGKLFEAAK